MRKSLFIAAALSVVGMVSTQTCTMSCIMNNCGMYQDFTQGSQCALQKCGCDTPALYQVIGAYQTCIEGEMAKCQTQFGSKGSKYFSCAMNVPQKCLAPTVALLNQNSARLPCFDGALSEDECVDLYTFSLFAGKVDDNDLLRTVYGQQRDIFKVLLERQRADFSALSLASYYTNGSYP
jgi:hypothetical protein